MNTWAIVPVKPLANSKSRLAGILSPAERAELTRQLFIHVLSVVQQIDAIDHVLVVSRDPQIAQLAEENGCHLFGDEDPLNLNIALTRAAQIAWYGGAQTLIVLPADLALLKAPDVAEMLGMTARIVICPDDRYDGTNALLLRNLPNFQFLYGEDSFTAHLGEAARHGIVPQVMLSESIEFDLDTPADWQRYQRALAKGLLRTGINAQARPERNV